MSSPKYQLPVYQIPSKPSRQLKVVLDYFNYLKIWDLETLSQLTTPYLTQVTLPESLGIPARNKSEDIEFLHSFRDSLKGAHLELVIHELNEDNNKVWVHLTMKTVGIECFFNFTFGTGKDENLIVNVTEFVDSKVFSGGGGSDGGDSSSAKPNAQPETPLQALSSSVQNCVKTMGQCYLDVLLFVPRSVKYVVSAANH